MSELEYRPNAVARMAKVVLPVMERLLPKPLYRTFYNFAFQTYRGILRLLYARFWVAALLTGDREKQVKIRTVFSVMPYSLVGWPGLEATYDVVATVESKGIPGCIVECGVAQGGSAALMALVAARARSNRKIWLFDSYEGLPDPTKDDYDPQTGTTGAHVRPLPKGSCLGTYEQVEALLFDKFGLDRQNINMIKGWFQDTLPACREKMGRLAVARLDGDWYESVKCCLENLYDSVVQGGFIIIDDYYVCHGAKKALHEFVDRKGVQVELIPDGRGGCYFTRPV